MNAYLFALPEDADIQSVYDYIASLDAATAAEKIYFMKLVAYALYNAVGGGTSAQHDTEGDHLLANDVVAQRPSAVAGSVFIATDSDEEMLCVGTDAGVWKEYKLQKVDNQSYSNATFTALTNAKLALDSVLDNLINVDGGGDVASVKGSKVNVSVNGLTGDDPPTLSSSAQALDQWMADIYDFLWNGATGVGAGSGIEAGDIYHYDAVASAGTTVKARLDNYDALREALTNPVDGTEGAKLIEMDLSGETKYYLTDSEDVLEAIIKLDNQLYTVRPAELSANTFNIPGSSWWDGKGQQNGQACLELLGTANARMLRTAVGKFSQYSTVSSTSDARTIVDVQTCPVDPDNDQPYEGCDDAAMYNGASGGKVYVSDLKVRTGSQMLSTNYLTVELGVNGFAGDILEATVDASSVDDSFDKDDGSVVLEMNTEQDYLAVAITSDQDVDWVAITWKYYWYEEQVVPDL